jgi:hypothetical protein
MAEMVRTHVVLPKELVDAIDALAGPRKRSEYVAEILAAAVAEKLRRERVYEAALRAAGSIPQGAVPEWDTEEGVRKWLKELREEKSNRTRSIEAAWAESDTADLAASQR